MDNNTAWEAYKRRISNLYAEALISAYNNLGLDNLSRMDQSGVLEACKIAIDSFIKKKG